MVKVIRLVRETRRTLFDKLVEHENEQNTLNKSSYLDLVN